MRLFSLIFLGAVLSCALAEGNATSAVVSLPSCAQSCLKQAMVNSPCAPTNQTCICTDAPLQAAVEVCVMEDCTIKQALATKNITQTACRAPVRDKSVMYDTISISTGSISAFFVVIRILYKLFATMDGKLGLDDWFILATIFSGLPSTVMNTHGFVANGMGRDVWTLTPETITKFAFFFYVMEVLYFAQVTLLKMSILFFYMNIFRQSGIKNLIWGTVAFNAVFGTVFVFLATFQCSPISFYWTKWDEEHIGFCMDINGIAWANAGLSICLDLWMLGLPLSQVRSLKLHWKKKIGVALMFCVGTFVTVVSILRLQTLVAFATSHNPTWDQFAVAAWSTVEINVGIMCACMPSMRVILVHFFPKFLATTQRSTSTPARYKYYYHSSQKSGGRSRSRTLGNEAEIATVDPGSVASGGSSKGIIYTKEYAVDYNDETSLVRMREMEASSSKTGRTSKSL
ncbi:hypothetical protein CCHL11_06972 [Colletotrichum chlorophyti]|uniref:CFEM domain-containing protein n=1 Tax=Colletotrichum chlorophyti TaxID=708187 RepID=A0A1Q8RCD5_9PEZI|nr:hypothetical protein CCHL11_06972 [Colletotrichum chlorophyti]